MNKKYILITVLALLVFSGVLVSNVQATVGGPSFIYDFKYNPQNESVYYKYVSEGGRGCPPELMKISLNDGKVETVFSCDDGEKYNYELPTVDAAINKITESFKQLTPLNLRESNITIDINFLNSENYSPEFNELLRRNFNVSVYQNNIKVTDFTISGCKMDQPFVFAGYAIPGFDKKIILLSSAVDNCNEGGYIYEILNVVGGVDNLKKDYWSNSYKGSSALVPNEGSLVIYEADKINNVVNVDIADDLNEKSESSQFIFVIIITSVISILVGISIGVLIGKLFAKNRSLV